MQDKVFRDGMELSKIFEPVPKFEGMYYLQAVHGSGWVARSYFIEREAGNILVSPLIYTKDLGDFIDAHGGLAYIFVSHLDEINKAALCEVGREGLGPLPDHIPACEYKNRFQCRIIAHVADTLNFTECQLDTSWDADFSLSSDLHFIHTPGHTQGSACLRMDINERRVLFCGDILGLNDSGEIDTDIEEAELSRLQATLNSWSKMTEHDFDALIPLHTFDASPIPFIAKGGRDALRQAIEKVNDGWNQSKHA
ncbi:MAG TPA: MBL fold metallo-hydrolase [Anaerolineales bacterium]|nr:MBL fold metallo-hydrolase [Anaerolineales bacterium]